MPEIPIAVFKKPELGELGATGIEHFSGYLVPDEHSLDMRGETGRLLREKMIKDPDISMGLNSYKLNLLSADREIVSANDGDNKADEIKDFVRHNFFEVPSFDWPDIIHHAIFQGLGQGSIVNEPIWGIENGKIIVERLAPRLRKTIYKWLSPKILGIGESREAFAGIEQMLNTPNTKSPVQLLVSERKAFIMVWGRLGSNWEGTAFIRPTYKPWFFKRQMEQFQMIYGDRFGCGIPKIKAGEHTTPQQLKDAIDVAKNMKAGEYEYLVSPFGGDIGILEAATENMGRYFKETLSGFQFQIARTMYTMHLYLGEKTVGSFALSSTQALMHFAMSTAIAEWIADAFNNILIPWLVDMNFGPQEAYPKLTFGAMKSVDLEIMGKAISEMTNAGLLEKNDPEIRQAIRAMLEFPDLPDNERKRLEKKLENSEEMIEAGPPMLPQQQPPQDGNFTKETASAPPAIPPKEEPKAMKECSCSKILAERNFRPRDNVSDTVKDIERSILKLDELVRGLDSREAQAIQKAKAFEAKITRPIAEAAAKGKNLNTFKPPGVKQFQNDLIDSMFEAAGFGIKRLESELTAQGVHGSMLAVQDFNISRLAETIFGAKSLQEIPFGIDDETASLIIEIGEKQTELLVNRFKTVASTASTNVTRQEAVRRAGARTAQDLLEAAIPDEEKINDIIREIANLSDKPTEASMRAAISESHGLGRNAAAKANQGNIILEVYSAVLDGNLCDVCGPLDGQTHVQGDPMFTAPNPNCFGTLGGAAGNPCRCLNLVVSSRELAEKLLNENPALRERLRTIL